MNPRSITLGVIALVVAALAIDGARRARIRQRI